MKVHTCCRTHMLYSLFPLDRVWHRICSQHPTNNGFLCLLYLPVVTISCAELTTRCPASLLPCLTKLFHLSTYNRAVKLFLSVLVEQINITRSKWIDSFWLYFDIEFLESREMISVGNRLIYTSKFILRSVAERIICRFG